MTFRPFLWLTVVTLPALLVLVGLGTWQLGRLQWKNDLIDRFEARVAAPPMVVPANGVATESFEFRQLELKGSFLHEKEILLTGRTYEGNAGFHVVTPFELADGRVILINRGWVSEIQRSLETCIFSDCRADNGHWNFTETGSKRLFCARKRTR